MKRVLILIGLLSMIICQTFAQSIPAFPGAEGFGKYTTGGRGGAVYIVTNLNDSGVGSLRWALEAREPRIVVFEVSGTIELQSPIRVRHPHLTIAGQTAPGDGITVSKHGLNFLNMSNVIVRYIRFRPGDVAGEENQAAFGVFMENAIFDHCSFSWAIDEIATFYKVRNFTLQYSIISEALHRSVHSKGPHGFGSIAGGQNVSWHHNLLAHANLRMTMLDHPGLYNNNDPQQIEQWRGITDFRNNVIYNWEARSTSGGAEGKFNIINNYYKPGPSTLSSAKDFILNPLNTGNGLTFGYGKFYLNGNILHGNSSVTNNNWLGARLQTHQLTQEFLESTKSHSPFSIPTDIYSKNYSAEESYERVLNSAGASFKRDLVDTRIIEETRTGTYTFDGSNGSSGGIIDSQKDVGGWPVLQSLPAPLDTDRDGMPDEWEIAHGLDPNKRDHNGHDLDPHYTNIEVYINSIVSEDAMDLTLPGRLIVIAPAIDEVIIANEVSFEWNLLNESKSYHLQIASDSLFNQIVKEIKDIQSANITVTDLNPEQTYFWRIRAGSDQQYTAWSEVRSFTLLAPFNNSNTDGLVGYWKMDEGQGNTLNDSSGNQNHATILNSNDVVWEEGVVDLGINLPGTTNRIATTVHNSSLRFDKTLTIAAWLKPTRFGRNTIIHKNYEGKGFELSLENDGTIAFRTNRNGTPSNRLTSNFNYEPFLNQWIHVAATFNGTSSRIYINGQLDSQANFSERDITSLGGDLVIGALGTIQRFTGTLDEFRLYDRTLTAEEVLELYLLPESLKKPTTPTLISPENNLKDLTNEVAFSWESIPNAISYTLQLSSNPNFQHNTQEFKQLAANSFTVDQLDFGQVFFWRVQAVNGNGSSEFSEVFSFETLHAPASPTLLLPESAGDNLVNPLTFSWEASEDSDSYHLQIATDVNFNQLFVDKETITVGAFTVNELADGSTYFWRVRASNAAGFGPYSEVRSFQTAVPVVAPIKPSLIAPTHEAAGLENPVELSWERIPNATSYHVQLAIDSEFVNLISDQQQVSSEQLQISGLAEGTSYFWRVRAENEAGFGPYSDVRNFSTKNSEERDEDKGEREDDSKDDEEDKNEGESNEKEGNEDGSSEEKEDEVEKGTTEEETNEAEENNTEEGSSEEENTTEEGTTEGENNTEEGSSEEGSTEEENNTEEGSSEEGSTEEENNTEEGSSEEGSTKEENNEGGERDEDKGENEDDSEDDEDGQEDESSDENNEENLGEKDEEKGEKDEDKGESSEDNDKGQEDESSDENDEGGEKDEKDVDNGNTTEQDSTSNQNPTAVPLRAILVSPAHQAANLAIPVVLTWERTAEAARYQVQIATDESFDQLVFEQHNVPTETLSISSLSFGTTYFWRVRAANALGFGPYAVSRTFTTGSPVTVPARTILGAPVNNATELEIPVTLSWNSLEDANHYHVQVAIDENFQQLILDDRNVNALEISLNNLNKGLSYFWRVRGGNTAGFGSFSERRRFSTVTPTVAPSRTNLISPINNAIAVPSPVVFTWERTPAASTYQIQVSTNNTFTNLVVNESGIIENQFSINTLQEETTYFWRVRATNATGSGAFSTIRSFQTAAKILAPTQVQLVSPANQAEGLEIPVQLRWKKIAQATQYQLQVASDANFNQLVLNETGLSGEQFTLQSLETGTSYFWRVRASNSAGTGAYSSVRSFSTKELLQVPEATQLLSPANQASSVQVPVLLTWEKTATAEFYHIQVAKDQQFQNIVLEDKNRVTESIQAINLEAGTTYFWRVSAGNAAGIGAFSSIRSFTTQRPRPDAPILVSPGLAQVVSHQNIHFTWNSVENANTYQLQVSMNANFTQSVILTPTNLQTTSFTLESLEADEVYFWRVRAFNEAGAGAYSQGSSFITSAIPALETPVLVSPRNNSQWDIRNILLKWNAVEGAVNYCIQLSTDPSFERNVETVCAIQGTEYQVQNLKQNQVYYWRVQAMGASASAYSESWKFEITNKISENQPAQVKVTSYPNPFTDQINLMFTPGFDEALFVTVYTNKGVVLFEKTYESSMDIISISLPSNLPKGMYRVRIQSKSFSDNIGMIKK